MESGHEPIRRGLSWAGPGANLSSTSRGSLAAETNSKDGSDLERSGTGDWEKNDQGWVKERPGLTSSPSQLGRKTNLSRSASLSEKELKEARTRSQIIAAQLTIPSNPNSRGVQLFNRRKQRVNAFTLVSVGEAGRRDVPRDEKTPSPQSAVTWEKKYLIKDKDSDINHKNSGVTNAPWSSAKTHSAGSDMEDQSEAILEVEEVDNTQERHFLPVKEKDEELPEELVDEVKDENQPVDDNTTAVPACAGQEEVTLNEASTNPATAHREIPNGCHSTERDAEEPKPLVKQPVIINRTARPFFSPTTALFAGATSPVMDIPPAPSYSTPPLPAFREPEPAIYSYSEPQSPSYSEPPRSAPVRQVFSPPPPPPSYPTPPLPSYGSPPPPADSRPPSGPAFIASPPPSYYGTPTVPRPTFVPQMLSERRPVTPIKTGILDEGRVRRSNRKSMFTFQEKPKVAPNPELLSLVQGADQKKVRPPQEPGQEEELLALGAEASNFLAKDEADPGEAMVPEWASCLRSSRTRTRTEHKPEQALTDAAGKGAELFAKRQTRMEKYIMENSAAGQKRSPSPTMSLPPSWIYPSNMPGRVKAIVNSSNIGSQISRTLKAQQPAPKKNVPAPAPPPPPESPTLENGCTKIEMELSKHQPYQLNSSLFILNPTRDPMSSLPRAAPPPKPVVTGYSRQSSLPTTPTPPFSPSAVYRSAHCFSPPMMPLSAAGSVPSRVSSVLSPGRVASPRSAVQAPRPTFSAKKAGIEPQMKQESRAAPPQQTTARTPPFTRRFSSPEGASSGRWSPSVRATQVASPRPLHLPMAVSPVSPPWDTRCQSPIIPQELKANHRLLAKNIINAAKRKNSPSPGALSGHGLPISPVGSIPLPYEHKPMSPFQPRSLGSQSPTFTSPPPTPTRLTRSPVRLYNTRSLTDSDASVESEDSGLRSPGMRSYNTCPRGWTGSLRIKRGCVPADL